MKAQIKFCVLASGISALLMIASTNSRATEVLVNGGFESEPNFGMGVSGDGGYSALTGSQIPGWTIEPGHAATVHNTAFYPFISGNFSINMDGEGFNGQNANLYQDFATNLGYSYAFSFDWQGWMNNAPNTLLQVSIVDLSTAAVLFNQTYSFDTVLHHEGTTFLGTGDMLRLRIQENPQSGFNDNQFIVDNFSVDVPEAGTLSLLIVGAPLLAIGCWRRLRASRR